MQPPDLSFWTAFQNNPTALVMVIIGTILIVLSIFVLPKIVGKRAEVEIKKIEVNKNELTEENNRLIKGMGNVAGRIEDSINVLNKKYDELSEIIQKQSRVVDRTSRQIDMLIVLDEKMEILDRLIAFNWCLKVHKNGKIYQTGCDLILHNKSTWQWVLEHDLYKQPNNEKYQKLLEKIDKNIFFV